MINPTKEDIGRKVIWNDGDTPADDQGILALLSADPDAVFVLYDGAVEPIKTPVPKLTWA